MLKTLTDRCFRTQLISKKLLNTRNELISEINNNNQGIFIMLSLKYVFQVCFHIAPLTDTIIMRFRFSLL